ncbi:hypothetical protein POM88_033048 [Heracleum sosnowskyi]|uniref:DUF6598 domain-containing protein n=1 Tax=Heracleum sosnowskyi TaxID=360622 RepID=A0AAD8I3G1_9APIA|nr:hypothetical protein POM88_033048 [Heracleum sosnowskyi]
MSNILNYGVGISPKDDDDEYEDLPRATPVVEVFNIIYLGQDEVKPEKQLGTIIFHTCPGIYYLYKVEEVDPNKPSIRYGDIIPLNVASPCFGFQDDYVRMEFDLFCGAFKGVVYLDNEPIASGVSLTRVELNSTDYTGLIRVNLGAFPVATTAKLELKLVNNSAPVNISGAIYASNASLESSNAASLLFHDKLGDSLVGHDGVIPLNKSIVGVPLHSWLYVEIFLKINGDTHTANLTFDVKETGQEKTYKITDRGVKIRVKIIWGDFGHSGVIYRPEATLSDVNRRMLRLGRIVSEYSHFNKVMEKVIDELGPPSVTFTFLSWLYRSEADIRAAFIKGLHPVVLFNLIQVAHRFQIKSIMDLACLTLTVKFKTKAQKEITKEFSMDEFYNCTVRHIKSIANLKDDYVEESLKILEESRRFPCRNGEIIFRQRGKETLINISHLVDVRVYPFATERLPVIKKRNTIFVRCMDDFMDSMPEPRNLGKMLEATRWLTNLINGDLGFADVLCSAAVWNLQKIVSEIYLLPEQESGPRFCIQMCAVSALSRAVSRRTHRKYLKDAVHSFVKLMSESRLAFNKEAVIALTHLAYACPDSKSIIFEKGALEAALKVTTNPHRYGKLGVLCCVANFLAVVCSTYFPEDKVKVALAIVEILLEKETYLSYQHGRKLVEVICNCFPIGDTAVVSPSRGVVGVAGSVLGVFGNISRWGHSKQIESLARDQAFLRRLGGVLRCGVEKFSKEACQIISNIGARGDPWILEMHKAGLIEPLLSLLETDMYGPDVRMEAACAIYNGIYGNGYRPIDVLPARNDLTVMSGFMHMHSGL